MRLPSVLSDSVEIVQIGVQKVANSERTTAFVSAYSVVAGLSAFIDWFSRALPSMAILAGLIGALVLAYLNWKKIKVANAEALKLGWEAEAAELKVRALREQMRPKMEMRKGDEP